MRSAVVVACLLLGTYDLASAQVSVGITLRAYPDLVAVPGYPVYYAPQLDSNFFFYDGLYWVYAQDRWYAGSWYDGPWEAVAPEGVPFFVLRVPVRYYRHPPSYFGGWAPEAPPRWGEHWGRSWEERRGGWDRWDRAAVPARAPLPTYQREYSGARYPRADQQLTLRNQNYHYQPRDAAVRQPSQHPVAQATQRPAARSAAPQRQVQTGRDRPGTPQPSSAQAADTTRRPPKTLSSRAQPPPTQAPQETRVAQAERGKPPQSRGPAVQQTKGRPDQGGPRPESQPSRSQEPSPRPLASPAPGPKQDPEHDRGH
ncbi:MAG TPA: hypothetical protein VK676_07800 [Steroidobacteraceae bacterium]|jgi:hypothetical protein|nr:hypothetical protein [Steroidobacteraceae bacterium]